MQRKEITSPAESGPQRVRTQAAFTLVELIVVVTIIGILSTVGFVAYSGYITGARDGNRIANVTKLADSLQTYSASKSLPLPDDEIQIEASGTLISHQGYAGQNVLESIEFSKGGIDPKDDTYYTYYLTEDRTKFQLLMFLEEQTAKINSISIEKTFAADYSKRYPFTYGNPIGVLVSAEASTKNIPAQEISANISSGKLLLDASSSSYTAFFDKGENLTASGYTLWGLLASRLGEDAPISCPEGFIPVPGNPEFNTEGFCVAQYEMTYTDANFPNSAGGGADWNTISYVPGKQIVSMAGKYPIVDITQSEAITACKSLGNGYHLITNNEWMTIARNIESTAKNWSINVVGQGNIYNGVSGNTSYGCNQEGGNNDPRTNATKTGPGEGNCNPRRSHTLSNGQIIWDLSGNIWEHVNKANTIDGSGYNVGQTSISGSSNNTGWDDNGIYLNIDMKRYGAATFFGTGAGMGNIFSAQGVLGNILVRGGGANIISDAGIFLLNIAYNGSDKGRGVGFRCAK